MTRRWGKFGITSDEHDGLEDDELGMKGVPPEDLLKEETKDKGLGKWEKKNC